MVPLIPYFKFSSIDLFGLFSIQVPGLLLVFGLGVGVLAATLQASRYGLKLDLLFNFFPWLFVGLLFGSHLGYRLLYPPSSLVEAPTYFLKSWGESSVGAFIAAFFLGAWYFNENRLARLVLDGSQNNSLKYADVLVYGATLSWFFVRMGCFAVHDHPGVETKFWLGIYGICPSGANNLACHDIGLYESGLALAIFALLFKLTRKPHFPGFTVVVAGAIYGVGRFFLDELRHPLTDVRYFGYTPAQYFALTLLVLVLFIFLRQRSTR